MDYTRYNHLSHGELSRFIAALEHPSDLEVECMQRIDMLLDLVQELEEAAGTEPQHRTSATTKPQYVGDVV